MRITGWEAVLAHAIDTARPLPFAWGEHDCATWAFDVRAALRGEPSAADAWRGRYTTALGAARVRKRLGWETMQDMADDLLGDPLPSTLLARRGDIIMARDAFGICAGAECAFVGAHGLTALSLRQCARAWRV